MLEKEFEKLNKAYREYNLEEREEVSVKILNYIQDRLIKNKEDIEKISGIFKDISFERIMEIYLEEVSKPEIYKKQKTLKKLDNDFVYGTYITSVGNVVVEASTTVQVLKYFIYAIQSRNTITISDLELNDDNNLEVEVKVNYKYAVQYENLLNEVKTHEDTDYSRMTLYFSYDKGEYHLVNIEDLETYFSRY